MNCTTECAIFIKNCTICSAIHYLLQKDKRHGFTISSIEVGGKNKTKKQIRNAKMGYVVKDDIEYGAENIIPLWMFGLNY